MSTKVSIKVSNSVQFANKVSIVSISVHPSVHYLSISIYYIFSIYWTLSGCFVQGGLVTRACIAIRVYTRTSAHDPLQVSVQCPPPDPRRSL